MTTPGQTVGPFFGFALPYDGGADLVPPTHPDAIQLTSGGGADSFIATLPPDGTALRFSTYLGGSGSDLGTGVSGNTLAMDTVGAVYVTSGTDSPDFPTTPDALQPRLGGGHRCLCRQDYPYNDK